MPEETIRFEEKRTFLGRNGEFTATGTSVSADNKTLMLEPVTTKDLIGRCRIELPANEAQALIDAVNKVVGHLATPEEIRLAREEYAEEGRIEIDDNAVASRSDEGRYVQAWVWVANKEEETEEEQENQPTASTA
jgi:hypothetical protein